MQPTHDTLSIINFLLVGWRVMPRVRLAIFSDVSASGDK
jgi:hypothetical protein